MIREIAFKDFKRLRQATVPLGPFQVVVGDTGAGKSTVLDGLELLAGLAGPLWEGVRGAAPGANQVLRGRFAWERIAARPGTAAPELVATLGSSAIGTTFTVRPRQDGPGSSVELQIDNCHLGPTEPGWTPGGVPDVDRILHDLASVRAAGLGPAQRLRLDPDAIAAPSPAATAAPVLQVNGAGLATVLTHRLALRDGSVEAVEADLARLVPGARRLRTVPVPVAGPAPQAGGEGRAGHGVELDVEGLGWVPAEALSDGTRVALAVLTALHDSTVRLLLVDDLERGLHPRGQAALVAAMRAALARRAAEGRPLQIVATSRSPFALDGLDAEEVRVVAPIRPGVSAVRSLAGHADWERLKGQLQAGEFWSFVGEGWVGGRLA